MKGNIFQQVQHPKVASSTFDMSHDRKMTFDMGKLVPSMLLETLPGDYFEFKPELLLRFAPLVSPVMHQIKVNTHYFFVPNRILWPEWTKWITGESEVSHPYFEPGASGFTIGEGDVGDYLELVRPGFSGLQVNAFPVAAYLKIYDEYYRDQNLITEKFVELVAGDNAYLDDVAARPALARAWNHDYFTSCLPTPQQGQEVTLPLLNNDTAPVVTVDGQNQPGRFKESANDNDYEPQVTDGLAIEGNVVPPQGDMITQSGFKVYYDPAGTLEVDINAEASTITTLRRAFKLQEFLERDMRGGTRYVENIYSHFGERVEDYRLTRPEYLGGVAGNMVISEVLSTAQTEVQAEEYPIGYLGGHGIGISGGNKISYKCKEHGFILGITSVRPRTAYRNGIHKMHRRFDRLDYAWPEFAHIGEQAVTLGELFADQVVDQDEYDTEFGYIPRFAEYKFKNSTVHGYMQSTFEYWHLGRSFSGNAPLLNEQFIECEPSKRIFVDQESHTIYAHIINNVYVNRKLPKFGNPKL